MGAFWAAVPSPKKHSIKTLPLLLKEGTSRDVSEGFACACMYWAVSVISFTAWSLRASDQPFAPPAPGSPPIYRARGLKASRRPQCAAHRVSAGRPAPGGGGQGEAPRGREPAQRQDPLPRCPSWPHGAERRCLPQARRTVDGGWGADRGLGSRCQRGSLTGGEGRVREPSNLPHPEAGKGGALEADRWPCGLGGGWGGASGHHPPSRLRPPEPGSRGRCSSSPRPRPLEAPGGPAHLSDPGPAQGPRPSSSPTGARCAP